MARYARITTVAYQAVSPGPRWIERTRDSLAEHLALAAQARPDLVVFPECLNCTGLPVDEWADMAETIPGPTFDRIAALAAEHRTYVCLPLLEREGEHLRNTAAFIDREGKLVGKYFKHVPTILELEIRVLPGVEVPAFDTDFGRVGAAICFDLKFNEVGMKLAESGAQLVCFVSQFMGGDRLLHWARDYGFYLVSCETKRSRVVDMAGRFLGGTGWEDDQVAWGHLPPLYSTVLNMDRMFFHLAYNQDHFPAIIKKYGAGVEIESHYPEAHCTIASLMDNVSMQDIAAEFGLEPWVDYLNRCRAERERYLEK